MLFRNALSMINKSNIPVCVNYWVVKVNTQQLLHNLIHLKSNNTKQVTLSTTWKYGVVRLIVCKIFIQNYC